MLSPTTKMKIMSPLANNSWKIEIKSHAYEPVPNTSQITVGATATPNVIISTISKITDEILGSLALTPWSITNEAV